MIRRLLRADMFDKLLPSEYQKLKNYLGLVRPSMGHDLVAEC